MDEAEFRSLLLALTCAESRAGESPARLRRRAAMADLISATAELEAEAIQVLADLARRLALQEKGGVARK